MARDPNDYPVPVGHVGPDLPVHLLVWNPSLSGLCGAQIDLLKAAATSFLPSVTCKECLRKVAA